jgi:hypothetical protein
MATLTIYQDSRGSGTCRSCGAPITWAELTSGKRMPFDGELVTVRTQGSLLTSDRIVEVVDTDITPSHFQTCPQAQQWRRR